MIHLSTWANRDCTLGRLRYGSFRCFTLELPWRDNRRRESCIPSGIYWMKKYNSPKFGEVFLLEGVPGRAMIEIHPGNYTEDIEGCILVGDSITYLNTDGIPDVTNSRETMKRLLSAAPDKTQIEIQGEGRCW